MPSSCPDHSRAKECSCRRLYLEWQQRPGEASPRYGAGLQAAAEDGLPLTAQRLRFSLLGGGGEGEGWGSGPVLSFICLEFFFHIYLNIGTMQGFTS